MEHEEDNYTNCDWCFGTVTKVLLKGLEVLEVGGQSGGRPNYSITENSQNTYKTPGDFVLNFSTIVLQKGWL